MGNTKGRRHFTGQEKVSILRRHLVDKVPVSDLCEEHGIHPTLFYRWRKNWFEQGAVVFDTSRPEGKIAGLSSPIKEAASVPCLGRPRDYHRSPHSL